MKGIGGSILALLLVVSVNGVAGAATLRGTSFGGGAQSLGMGEGGGAASSGAESLFWSPAGIATAGEPEFLLGHTSWVQDLNLEAGAVVLPLGELGVAGASASWQSFAGIEERDEAGNLVKKFTLVTGGGSVAYAHSLGSWLSAGVNGGFQILNGLDIEEKTIPFGGGLLADLGDYRIGISAIGVNLPQPTYQVSGSWKMSPGGFGMLLSGGAILREDENRAGVGVEVNAGRTVRFRVGYMLPFQETELGSFSNLTAGIGLAYQIVGIDYAFLPLGDLGQVHRIQATLRLPDSRPVKVEPASASSEPAAVQPAPEPAPQPAMQPAVQPTAQPVEAEAKPAGESVKEAPKKKDVEIEFVVPVKKEPKTP